MADWQGHRKQANLFGCGYFTPCACAWGNHALQISSVQNLLIVAMLGWGGGGVDHVGYPIPMVKTPISDSGYLRDPRNGKEEADL